MSKITELIAEAVGAHEQWVASPDIPRLTTALEAVLALHQPYPDDAEYPGEPGECAGCRNGEDMCCGEHPWPCATIAAVTAALVGDR
jgi:hypothetical protein